MSAFTCITCRVAFADADLQRAHYKADWHRYNLKRKVAELPPVTADNFQARVLSQKAQVADQEVPKSSHCAACNKNFNTENAYTNHLQSKKHKEQDAKLAKKAQQGKQQTDTDSSTPSSISGGDIKVQEKNAKNQAIKDSLLATSGSSQGQSSEGSASGSKAEASMVVEEEDDDDADSDAESWDGDALGLEECLFCSRVANSLEDNVEHMTGTHSFFLPDVEYLTDMEGLVTYLGQKVGEGHICLWCNEKGRSFQTTKAVQQHMIDKGHCKMLHDGDVLVEYVDFYDYRSSYPDQAEHEDGQEAPGGTELMEHDGRRVGRSTEDRDDEVDQEYLAEGNYQLVLPSGSSIGHRSLQRYYRQKLVRKDRSGYQNSTSLSRVMAHYKGLGWTGCTDVGAPRRARDMAYMRRVEFKQYTRLGVKANKLQHHYREQNPI